MSARKATALLLVAVCLVAVNLRITITSVGPLIEQIETDLGASPAVLGLLGSVPLLCWAVLCPFAHALSLRFGMTVTVDAALVLMAAGTLWRSVPGLEANVWAGTVLIGMGTAIGNVLMPAAIKRGFGERVPVVMGLYSSMVAGAAALGAGTAVPISQLDVGGAPLGWRAALLCTGVFVLPALAAWAGAARAGSVRGDVGVAASALRQDAAPGAESESMVIESGERHEEHPGRRIWGDGLAWFISLYMGAQGAIFFALTTWLVTVEGSLGRSAVAGGFDVMMMAVCASAGSLSVAALYAGRLRAWLPVLIPVPLVFGLPGFLIAPELSIVWAAVCGWSLGASMSMALLLIAVRSRRLETATALSGMVHSVGYGIGAAGPIAFGAAYQVTGDWPLPFSLLLLFTGVLFWSGAVTRHDRTVLSPRPALQH